MKDFRKLKANEIDCRIASKAKNGAIMLLLYKDARVDQNILDETFGIFGWQRKHEIIGGNLYCTVSVKNPETGEWVEKQDVGVESATEKEKGQASDSFKRACFNLGIGRELYTAPQIWIHNGDYKPNDRDSTYDRFIVKEIEYDGSEISKLKVFNQTLGRIVFEYDKSLGTAKISATKVKSLLKKCEDSGINPDEVCAKVGVEKLEDINEEQFRWIANNWTKEIVNGM